MAARYFVGGMYSTQRSKSLKGRLKAYLNSSQNLLQFFHHYYMLVKHLRYKEFLLEPIIPSPILQDLGRIHFMQHTKWFKMDMSTFVISNIRNEVVW